LEKKDLDKEDDDLLKLKGKFGNLDNAIDSGDDSECDESPEPEAKESKSALKKRLKRERKLAKESKRISKEKAEGDDLAAHIERIR